MRIAIQPDHVVHKGEEIQSFSARWEKRSEAYDISTTFVDAYTGNALDEINACDAFMWRFPPDTNVCRFAQAFLNSVEFGLGKPVFPDWRTRWHMEDKIGQTLMLRAMGFPVPETRIFWSREQALEHIIGAEYPMVLKLASGFKSSNVRLLRSVEEGQYFLERLFGKGLNSLAYGPAGSIREAGRAIRRTIDSARRRARRESDAEKEIHRGYLYTQEFVPGNDGDTRVTIIGNRAFAFQRGNRPNDFRASGSGLIDWNPENISTDIIELAFRIKDCMQAQTVAVDVIRSGGHPLILELGLAYAGWGVRKCPGHWRRSDGEPPVLEWVEGAMNPEDAILDDFVGSVAR